MHFSHVRCIEKAATCSRLHPISRAQNTEAGLRWGKEDRLLKMRATRMLFPSTTSSNVLGGNKSTLCRKSLHWDHVTRTIKQNPKQTTYLRKHRNVRWMNSSHRQGVHFMTLSYASGAQEAPVKLPKSAGARLCRKREAMMLLQRA